MGTAARQLRLFGAGDQLQNLNACAAIVEADTARNYHLRENQGLHRVVLEQLIDRLPR